MTDLIYPLGTGSKWQNNEIRYSLRSVEQHLKNVGNIYIIGERVPFLKDVQWIRVADPTHNKETNIYFKTDLACCLEGVSSTFLLMNDDHYFLKNFDAGNFPFFYEGTLSEALAARKIKDAYYQAICNTIQALGNRGLSKEYYFDIHTPMPIFKKDFSRIMRNYPWFQEPKGYLVKSLYMNTLIASWMDYIDHVKEYPDQKINLLTPESVVKSVFQNADIFSTGPAHGLRNTILPKMMAERFPNPSRWEKTN